MSETPAVTPAPAATSAAILTGGAAPPAASAPPAAPVSAPVSTWMEGVTGDDLAWAQNKGFKSAADVIVSGRNLEKLIGAPADKVFKLTDLVRDEAGKYKAESRSALEKLGVPKEAKEYEIEAGFEPEFVDALKASFYEYGVDKSAAKGVTKGAIEFQKVMAQKQQQQYSNMVSADDQVLRREWGAAYDQNMNIAKEAVRMQGLDEKSINNMSMALGHARAVKMLHQIGLSGAEGRFVTGTKTTSDPILTPDQADAEIRALTADKGFYELLQKGDKAAVDKWTKLNMQKAAQASYQLNQPVNSNTWSQR